MNRFTESQRFNQWWLWLIIGIATLAPFAALMGIGRHRSITTTAVITELGVALFVIVLLRACHLKTNIDETGITYQMFPFHLKPKKIGWGEIERAYVRKYSPIGEFGGWGYRISFGSGTAFNIAGNMGLQILLVSGKKILIGTQQAPAMSDALLELVSEGIVNNDMVIAPDAI